MAGGATAESSGPTHRHNEVMKTSARNQLTGTVKAIRDGAVNAEVAPCLPSAARVVAIDTPASADVPGLRAGAAAAALSRASSVCPATAARAVATCAVAARAAHRSRGCAAVAGTQTRRRFRVR
ncbi:TOBE domain-containing protein [Azohydromonas sp.]|uniref:TOBE domain-containing protein n=1 Tax=Azohydromonas sp. TaxID=1872666 RepID=UPI002B52BB53|nr:TOBE domain-containing protein [Azohydromonas sp.]HMM84034.1 TOBE domain-containing protein [Azohydromonas sp.]